MAILKKKKYKHVREFKNVQKGVIYACIMFTLQYNIYLHFSYNYKCIKVMFECSIFFQ